VKADIRMLYHHSSGSPWPRLIFGCFLVKWGHMDTHSGMRTLNKHKGRKWWESKLERVWRSVVILPYFTSWRHTYTLLFPMDLHIYIFKCQLTIST